MPATSSQIYAVLGDSIALNAPSRAVRPWTSTLDLMIHPARGVANRAKNSQQTSFFLTQWTNTVRSKGFAGVIIGPGCVNDHLNDVAAATSYANVNQIITEALSDGLNVIAITSLPFKNATGWTSGRQTLLESYNALLLARPAASKFRVLDVYPTFGSVADPAILDDAWQGPDLDKMHIGQAGGDRLANFLNVTLATL